MAATRYYWWIAAKDSDNHPYLIFGSENGEDDARRKGLEMLPGTDFEIVRLRTRNQAAASAQYKGVKLGRVHSLDEASRRLGHEKSLRKIRRRRALRN